MLEARYSEPGLIECGTDEVGRGCLAGPVVAAAVILPEGFHHPKLKDSKKMTVLARNEVFSYIQEKALSWSIAQVPAGRIDEVNILNASMEAMHQAIASLAVKPNFVIVDGNQFRPYPGVRHACIVKGDNKYASIAAASVLAKVYRDRLMLDLDVEYPGYGWDTNAGYGTKAHIDAIHKMGPTEYHRRSFLGGILKSGALF